MSTGHILKQARLARGLTQKELAIAAFGDGQFQSLISRWEMNSVEPSLESLRRLTPILHLSLGDFTHESTEPNLHPQAPQERKT